MGNFVCTTEALTVRGDRQGQDPAARRNSRHWYCCN
jgi:hypothetical protein